jgi:hypothetical protein
MSGRLVVPGQGLQAVQLLLLKFCVTYGLILHRLGDILLSLMFPETTFDRTLEADHLRIRSVCNGCGMVIVSSVLEGLAELEASHLADCKKPNASVQIALPKSAKSL